MKRLSLSTFMTTFTSANLLEIPALIPTLDVKKHSGKFFKSFLPWRCRKIKFITGIAIRAQQIEAVVSLDDAELLAAGVEPALLHHPDYARAC